MSIYYGYNFGIRIRILGTIIISDGDIIIHIITGHLIIIGLIGMDISLGYYPTYFNSYDNNSVYYGVRENNNNRTPEAFANRYVQEVKERPQKFDFTNDSEENKPNYSSSKPSFINTISKAF